MEKENRTVGFFSLHFSELDQNFQLFHLYTFVAQQNCKDEIAENSDPAPKNGERKKKKKPRGVVGWCDGAG